MTTRYVVTGPKAVVVAADGARLYLDEGATVPAGADQDRLDHLISVGLVGEASDAVIEAEEVSEEAEAAAAAGDGLDTLKLAELQEYASSNSIPLGAARTKAEVIAAIRLAEAE